MLNHLLYGNVPIRFKKQIRFIDVSFINMFF